MAKYIFVTGGVVSSVGKGVTVASIGTLLKSRGISVAAMKLDPYLNVDPGTMNPYQHGECFVTEDGAETDLDLGHYERFIDVNLTKASNVTTGQVYTSVINKERRGDFLGGTIQVVPHVTNEIKQRIQRVAKQTGAQAVIVEVGGTVGDIESLPFLEAIRQMHREVGYQNALYIHVTLLPYISATGELKTKPTQHSVKELRSIGIQPDVIVCRSDHPVNDDLKEKIGLFCDVEKRAVIALPTAETIYEVPLLLEVESLGDFIAEKLGLPNKPDLADWRNLVEKIKRPKSEVRIALVGKYVELQDAYLSVRESLAHAAVHNDRDVVVKWVDAEVLEQEGGENELRDVSGILVPGGFGYRGIEGKIKAARYARLNKVPYLGLCLGMHVMVIELARSVVGNDEPNSTEFEPRTAYPVIDMLAEQRDVSQKGGTMRLGAYPCLLVPDTKAANAYGQQVIHERHRHRFEFNNEYRNLLTGAGLVIGGLSPDGKLVEIVEIADHPWMVACQFHPEFKSRPTRPHPLFRDFIGAAKQTLHDGDQRPLPLEQMLA
ncbi:MAG: CTP synthase [Dehalococcoidales bacterium]|nr:CTP synthase [Dehalococcoidales bacterium]